MNHGILRWNHDRNIPMPNGNHGESCKIHRNLTGILRIHPKSSTKLPSSFMYSSAQSAAPIHGAADEFKAELEVSRRHARTTRSRSTRAQLFLRGPACQCQARGARLEEVRRLAEDRLLSKACTSSSRSSRSSRRRGSGRRQRSSSSKFRKVIPRQ